MTDVQKQALKATVKTLAGMVAVAIGVPIVMLLAFRNVEIAGIIVSGAILVFLIKLIYENKLAEAEALARLNASKGDKAC